MQEQCRPTLIRLATAVPERVVRQRDLFERVFRDFYREVPNAEQIFQAAAVETRHVYMDPEVALSRQGQLSTRERMRLWRQGALELARRSVGQALRGLEPQALGSFIMVSCTGYDTPSPDMLLARELGLAATLRRTFIGHMGCYAAFNALKVALDALVARPDEAVLINCTELCSLHVRGEATAEQAVCHALFGDASASVVLAQAPAGQGPQVLRTHSETLYAEARHMGWEVMDDGFRMFLSPRVPLILARHVRGFVERLLAPLRLDHRQVRHWAIHPGGRRIVDIVGQALELGPRGLRPSLEVLRNHGNCSSPTVLLVLEHLLREQPPPGEHGVLMAFGPGLTLEGMVVRF